MERYLCRIPDRQSRGAATLLLTLPESRKRKVFANTKRKTALMPMPWGSWSFWRF
jgi:hypothetical protein